MEIGVNDIFSEKDLNTMPIILEPCSADSQHCIGDHPTIKFHRW